MFDFGLFIVLLIALAFGWSLGKYGEPRIFKWRCPNSDDYFKGLNYLINDQADVAVESFIEQLEVTPKTLEMHLSIGSILRRKGELDRAIRIHQNLINSQSLGDKEICLAQIELARDFYASGILDRAENILLDLSGRSELFRIDAQLLLISVYRDERSWHKAINIGNALRKQFSSGKEVATVQQQQKLSKALAHFCCELAEEALIESTTIDVQDFIAKALAYDSGCVRANLLAAKAAILAGNESKAKRYLLDVALQDESFFSEAVDVLATFSVDAETLQSVTNIQYKTPSHSGLMYMISANKQLFGDEQAEQVLKNELVSNPSFSGLNQYLELKSTTINDETNDLVKAVLQRLHPIRVNYECLHCGFRGSQMHWLCPSCKQWGEIRQRYGL